MHTRMLRLHFDLAEKGESRLPALDETFEAFGVTLEELRVAEENLLQTNEVLLTTRQQLDAERRRYRELFDLAPDAYLVTDPAGVILDANRAAAALLNVPQRFMAGEGPGQLRPRVRPPRLPRRAGRRRTQPSRPPPGGSGSSPGTATWSTSRSRSPPARVAARQGRELLWLVRDLDRPRPLLPAPRVADEPATPIAVERDRLRDLIDSVGVVVWEADPATDRLTLRQPRDRGAARPPRRRLARRPRRLARPRPPRRPPGRRLAPRPPARRALRPGAGVPAQRRRRPRRLGPRGLPVRRPAGTASPEALRGVLININSRKRIERRLHYARADAETTGPPTWNSLQDLCERLSLVDRPARRRSTRSLWAVLSVLGSDMGSVSLRDPDRDEARIAASAGLPDGFLAPARTPSRRRPLLGGPHPAPERVRRGRRGRA